MKESHQGGSTGFRGVLVRGNAESAENARERRERTRTVERQTPKNRQFGVLRWAFAAPVRLRRSRRFPSPPLKPPVPRPVSAH